MKKLKIFTLFWLLCLLLTPEQVFSQSEIINNYNVELKVVRKDTAGNAIELLNINDAVERIVISSNGNFLKTVTVKLNRDHPFLKYAMPYAIVRISLQADVDNDGHDDFKLQDKRAVITKSGNIKIVHHFK